MRDIKGFYVLLFCFSLMIGGCFRNMDCLFELPENNNQMALMEIIFSPDFSQSEILRESIFPGEGTHFSYEHELSRFHYSFHRRIALFDNADHGFVNYGFDKQVFDQGFSVTIIPYLPDNSSPNRSDYDYLLENNETVFDLWSSIKPENPFSGDSVSTFSSSLIRYNHTNSDTSVIFTHEPVFIDSSTFSNIRIVDLRYTLGGTLLVILNEIEYQIEYIEDYNYYHGVESNHNMFLIEINSDNSVDTLLSVPESDAKFPLTNLYVTQNMILMSANQYTYEYNMTSGEMGLLYEGTIPRNVAVDEQSLTFDDGNKYYRLEDDHVFDLSAYFSSIAYSIPYQNLVAVQTFADKDKIFIFDVDTEAIVHTITIDDLPEFNPVNGDSRYRLENPIFTAQGELVLMYFRETYLTDEDYERRCE